MSAIGYLLTLFLVIAAFLNFDNTSHAEMLRQAEVSAVVGNMMVYRNYVSAYAQANPTFEGNVPDAVLGMPSWYKKQPNMGGYLAGGKSYIFNTVVLPGLVAALVKKSKSISVGTNTGGFLLSPMAGNTNIPLPIQIPLSAVVIIQ